MNLKVIEKNIVSKHKSIEYCEDKIVYNNFFACVIDGATTKSTVLYENKTSGLLVSEILEKTILNLEEKTSLSQTIDILTNSVRDYYIANNLVENMKKNPLDRLTASIVIFSKYFNQIWMIGDCQCMVDNKVYTNEKFIDKFLSETRAFYITKELISEKSIKELQKFDTGRQYILPLLVSQSYFQNSKFDSEYSYCVIDGFPINISKIKVIEINSSKTIILASDGYPKLFNTLNETENYLDYILENDPLCYNLYKSTKGKYINMNSFDDRAYLRLEI
jgi:glycerophosphoryl diester phosphodiesterase